MSGIGHHGCCCGIIYKLLPCYVANSACSNCPTNETPERITAVFSGIDASACLQCFPYPDEQNNSVELLDLQVDGTYSILGNGIDPCTWDNYIAETLDCGSQSYKIFGNRTCEDPPSHTDDDFKVLVEISALGSPDLWSVYITGIGDIFYGEAPRTGCNPEGVVLSNTISVCEYPDDLYSATGGTVTLYAGDTGTANPRCPGGGPIYTDTDLAAYVGDVVEVESVCYAVSINTGPEPSDGGVTVTQSCANCPDCCDDDC